MNQNFGGYSPQTMQSSSPQGANPMRQNPFRQDFLGGLRQRFPGLPWGQSAGGGMGGGAGGTFAANKPPNFLGHSQGAAEFNGVDGALMDGWLGGMDPQVAQTYLMEQQSLARQNALAQQYFNEWRNMMNSAYNQSASMLRNAGQFIV